MCPSHSALQLTPSPRRCPPEEVGLGRATCQVGRRTRATCQVGSISLDHVLLCL